MAEKTIEQTGRVMSLNDPDIFALMVGESSVRVNRYIQFDDLRGMLNDLYLVVGKATETPTAEKIPIADENGLLNDWVDPIPTVPPGVVWMYGGASAPDGWLLCDGSSYLRSEHTDLFAAIGTSFGAVDGDHFYVPDLRGRLPGGAGTGAGGGASGSGKPTGGAALTARAVGDWLGEETHQLIEAELAAHTHTVPKDSGAGSGGWAVMARNISGTLASGSAGSGSAHNNIQPVVILNFIIKDDNSF